MRRNEAREQSQDKTNLTRSKSMGSLQSSAGSTGALKALFESKAATPNKMKSSFRSVSFTTPYKAAGIMPVVNGEVEEVKSSAVQPKSQIPADGPVSDAKIDAKDPVIRKVNTIIPISLKVRFAPFLMCNFNHITSKNRIKILSLRQTYGYLVAVTVHYFSL